MSLSPIIFYFVVLILFDRAVKSQVSSNSNSNAFIQGNNDVRYIVDNIPITVHQEFSGNPGVKVHNVEESSNSQFHLKFDPPLLDFKERPLGVPHHEKVTVVNLNGNKTVHMSSISGHTVHFHSSFFEDKVVVPLGNTSFNVVFLGREAGEVESNLFIHTSEGSFKYQVRGCSVQSPYRLRPLSGVRLPLNASFSPLIHMHNPYATPLQLVEVYSSGGEFHLELPSGELEGPKHLWEIPAFRTKPIIRVRFHARAQKNHTAYIRLKVNQSEEVLVVPLEVEVGPVCGLYSPEDVIDFGIGGSHDPPTTRKLWLHNSWKKPIKIQNIISTPVSKAFRIDFEPVKVPPETDEPTQVAQLTFDWRTALESGHTAGRIVVKSKQSAQKLVIPYTATVLSGGLSYDRDITRFRSDSEDIPPRTFHLVNNFKLPIAITNVSLSVEARPYFKLRHFEPRILLSGQSVPLLEIVPTVPPHLVLDSALVIVTNVSTLNVPLLCYDGKLTKVISHRNESELELGTVGSGTEKQFVFALVNENPVPVTILSLETDLPSAAVSVAAVCSGSALSLLSHYSLHNDSTTERLVGPGQMAVVRLLLRTGAQVGEASALVRLRTEYESVELPVHVRVEHGSLLVTPDPVTFTNCFPSTVCLEVLRVQSLFSVAMAVTGVSAVPGDPRLSFSPVTPPLLLPASTTELGTLSFDTELLPPEENYLATTPNNTGSTRWQDTLELPAHTLDHDLSLLITRYEHYRNLSSRLLNLTLRLDTTEVRDHMFTARVRLSWPVLSADLSFPLTQVGNMSERSLVISNPGTRLPVLVQLVLEAAYPQAQSLLEGLPLELRPVELEDAQLPAGEFVIDASESSHLLAEMLHHRDSWLFLVPPRSNTTVRVKFSPASAHLSSTLLLLRNNLTVLEAVTLSGSGAFTQFKFGNRKPGSSTPLLFELAEKHLKDCEREKQRRFPAPNLTVKRSFTARNTGALPIAVHGFHISGLSCEGYGFRVLNCEAFNLPPNGTRKVDIAFTPDFTLARVQRTLGVWTSESDSVANYTLVATLPPYLLSSCSQVLARPAWEPLLYYCAVTFMVFLLVCVLAAAFLESDRALKCALLAMSRDTATVQPVLDLKSIGTGVGLGCSSGALSQGPDKTETPPSVSWTRPTPAPTASAVAVQEPTEPTAVKENVLKPETDVSGIFTSPATKCAKKKEKEKTTVSKRYSDPTDERHSSWAMFTKPAPGSLAKPHVKPTLPADTKRKLTKKTSNNTVSLREVMPLLPATNNSEDTETSSTTTESSHDDGDKEVEVASTHKCHKTRGSGKPQMSEGRKVTVAGGSASSLELEWEDEDLNDREATIKKPNASTSSRNRKTASKSAKVEGSQSSRGKTSSGLGKQPSIRAKDKQTLMQKRSADKLTTQPKPVVFEPPPPPLTLWDDSRASFSDVVARSDTSKHVEQSTLSLSPLQTTAPAAAATTVTTSGPAALGPIGSKKSYPSGWDCWSDSVCLTPATPVAGPAVTGLAMPSPAASTNSFFMDSFSDARSNPVMQSSGYDGWKDHALLLKLLQAEEQRRLEAEELQRSRPVYQDTWSPWSGSAPVAEPAPVPAPPGLWGSDVWAPPPPDTWAPPGLAPRPPPRLDDPINPDLDVGLDYDPFRSLSNIWAPHTPTTFWKPPTTSN